MLIELKALPELAKHIVSTRTDSEIVDIWWSNGCNEEGEDYYELYIGSYDNSQNFHYKYGWGEIESLEVALEELE